MYGQILVPVDGSDTSMLGLNEAVKLAKIHGSRIRLVHVVNEFILDYTYSPGVYASDLFEALRKTGKAVLEAAEKAAESQGIKAESVLLESIGSPAADLIVAQAAEWPADLIVMGTHGRRGLLRVALGSDAEQVLRATTVPVLLVRGAAQPKARAVPPATKTKSAA